jgi:hypothetical protein
VPPSGVFTEIDNTQRGYTDYSGTRQRANYPSECSSRENGGNDQHDQVQATKKVELPHGHGEFISDDCQCLQVRDNVLSAPAGFGLNHTRGLRALAVGLT